jgi:hypothetical protein
MEFQNINNIRKLISLKKYSEPIDVIESDGKAVITPYDVFPYNKWFKGQFLSSEPIVAEREAGYCKILNPIYPKLYDKNPDLCFQSACSLVKPCIPRNIAERDKLEINIPYKKYCCDKFI